ncbi:glycosyltransferase family 4 protein [Pelagibacteraceae bacterium]|jgi:phosphatidylinositol alpha-1,6-mannosyltransferase|nr:glycosyltransferase family 4 protein [Pelagibacteraceae bacterium]
MFVISTRNFPPDVGGIQKLMEGLANSLLNHGPVKIFADSFEKSEIYDKNSALNIQRISGFKVFKRLRKANLLNEFLKNNSIRAIFFDHWKSIEKIDREVLKKTISFCLIHSKEINHSEETNLNERMNKALSKSKYIIANSNFTKNLAVNYGVSKEKIKIIHPGSDYPVKLNKDAVKKADEIYKDSYPKIITVARLDKRKGHQNILMCIKNLKIKFPKIKYISIGDGEEKNKLKVLQKELGLDNEVTFLYKADDEIKNSLLNSSDLFLMPSIVYKKSVEGFGISFIEAASYKKGSIGGNCGGERDAIQDGETGYICDGDNLTSIYETVVKFFENNNSKTLGKNAYEFSKNFKWDKIVKEYLRLI